MNSVKPVPPKYQLIEKMVSLKRQVVKLELSSTDSVTTGVMVRHKDAIIKKFSRNGLAVMFYVLKIF
jgi:hypothetical protein